MFNRAQKQRWASAVRCLLNACPVPSNIIGPLPLSSVSAKCPANSSLSCRHGSNSPITCSAGIRITSPFPLSSAPLSLFASNHSNVQSFPTKHSAPVIHTGSQPSNTHPKRTVARCYCTAQQTGSSALLPRVPVALAARPLAGRPGRSPSRRQRPCRCAAGAGLGRRG